MEEKELQELFKKKIHLELGEFERAMLEKETEDVYYSAYRIDCMSNIFECLCEMSRKMELPMVKELLVFPNLLAFLYGCWMKVDDGHMEELRACLEMELAKLCETTTPGRKEAPQGGRIRLTLFAKKKKPMDCESEDGKES